MSSSLSFLPSNVLACNTSIPKCLATDTDVNIATTAVNALGHWFIERKRQQKLPELIGEMQEPVQTNYSGWLSKPADHLIIAIPLIDRSASAMNRIL